MREQRKVVTVLFCDLVGSTALGDSADPEVVRARMRRYFEDLRVILERHGGSVEKFVGDAVMAVFGIPTAHEDDALRAVRAAAEMREAIVEHGLEARIGISRPQKRPFAGREPCLEIVRGRLRIPPVAAGHARPGHPDLPHCTGRQLLPGLGIDHGDPLPLPGVAAAHQRALLERRDVRRRTGRPAGDE